MQHIFPKDAFGLILQQIVPKYVFAYTYSIEELPEYDIIYGKKVNKLKVDVSLSFLNNKNILLFSLAFIPRRKKFIDEKDIFIRTINDPSSVWQVPGGQEIEPYNETSTMFPKFPTKLYNDAPVRPSGIWLNIDGKIGRLEIHRGAIIAHCVDNSYIIALDIDQLDTKYICLPSVCKDDIIKMLDRIAALYDSYTGETPKELCAHSKEDIFDWKSYYDEE